MTLDGDKLKVYNAPLARRKIGSATATDVTILAAQLATETLNRIAGDNANAAAIAAEAATRAAADTAEAIARAAADTVLQNQITALQQPSYADRLLLGGT